MTANTFDIRNHKINGMNPRVQRNMRTHEHRARSDIKIFFAGPTTILHGTSGL